MEKKFIYAGHTFQGQRQFTDDEDFHEITKHLYSQVNDLSCKWNWKQFYGIAEKTSEDDFDIFMMDDKFPVVPAHNGLFIYGEETEHAYTRFLQDKKYFKGLNEAYQTYTNMLLEGIKRYIKNHGAIETLDGEFVPSVESYKEGIVTEEIKRIYINEEGEFCIDTDADSYTESDGNFSTMTLTAVLEYINYIQKIMLVKPVNKDNTQPTICTLMQTQYDAYCQKHGGEPLYAVCMVEDKEDKTTLEVTIKMASGSEDDEDNDVFYFCDTFSGLKGLTEPDGCTDFFITDFFYFC